MTDIHARIRVRETHGIRRFLYPLSTAITQPDGIDMRSLSLVADQREPVPVEVAPPKYGIIRLDLALSLDPFSEQELLVVKNGAQAAVPDPLHIVTDEKSLRSTQERFQIGIGADGAIRDVVYDGVPHLRAAAAVTLNGKSMSVARTDMSAGSSGLSAWVAAKGNYRDTCLGITQTEITACKSWAMVSHSLAESRPGDEILFTLPFAATADVLTYDMGVGDGVYGKLPASPGGSIVWTTTLAEDVQWSVATAGRTDYIGKLTNNQQFAARRWFHLIDRDKALAVAITQVPEACDRLTVTLNISGDVSIRFHVSDKTSEPVEFGVCYHFLNDIPAIAAATNPPSILLPPVVEALPA